MSKQTAVEWLVDYFKNLEKYPYKTIQELEDQAKAMEREQIIDAYDTNRDINTIQTAEQYYNETYKGGTHG